MQIIISHENLDFDGLASMVACSKIHPEGILVFSGRLNNNVKSFHRFYKNILTIRSANEIDIKDVQQLIIVDSNAGSRIGKFGDLLTENISILIYDHHIESKETIAEATKIIKDYGSCTTILVEEIKRNNIPITSFEATLFLLGIYTDTNCLTFSSTHPQDAEAVAYLLRNGADLEIVNRFIQTSLTNQHDKLFLSLLLNIEDIEINNYKIILSTYTTDGYIGELGYIANKMLEIRNCDAVFLIVKMEKYCYIIGRSLKEAINIPYILEEFNGAGHNKAASASIKNKNPEEIKPRLLKNLTDKIKPQITAKDIMNYPVKTVAENMTVKEVSSIMFRYGHTGMPVIRDKEIVGIISRTDIDKAMQHGLMHAPVKGFMTRKVKTINPDTSLSEINNLLVRFNIGRLPVIDDNKIIGIVTRTDLLRMLHGHNHPYWYKKTYNESEKTLNCQRKIQQLPKDLYNILKIAGGVGDLIQNKVFVVGGFVRDLLLQRENLDIDLVVEGDGISFARELNKKIKGEILFHKQFSTASIKLENNNIIDIVSARREYYEYPAALPIVERGSIWHDLFRRDFTINCMAIQLNSLSFGKLLDYFGGLSDIENKKIRVLYNLSFIEDPTRILRAIRFAARLDFTIEDETKYFIEKALNDDMISKVTDDRIREEITHILKDEYFYESVLLMESFNVFKKINPDLKVGSQTIKKLSYIEFSIQEFNKFHNGKVDKEIIKVMQILELFPVDKLFQIINKFVPNKSSIEIIRTTLMSKENVYKQLNNDRLDKYTLYNILREYKLESLIFYYNNCDNPYIKHYIIYYMLNLKDIKINITGKDLLGLGIKPGPIYKKILESILKAKILGEIYDFKDEINYALKLYKNKG